MHLSSWQVQCCMACLDGCRASGYINFGRSLWTRCTRREIKIRSEIIFCTEVSSDKTPELPSATTNYQPHSSLRSSLSRAGRQIFRRRLITCPESETLLYVSVTQSCVIDIWVFPKCFHWIRWIQCQNICHYSKKTRTCHLLP